MAAVGGGVGPEVVKSGLPIAGRVGGDGAAQEFLGREGQDDVAGDGAGGAGLEEQDIPAIGGGAQAGLRVVRNAGGDGLRGIWCVGRGKARLEAVGGVDAVAGEEDEPAHRLNSGGRGRS